ncbi:MAG: NAD(P)/FAD-dependent oxidoreductase, partial [Crocinitomicaceae bacterium]
ENKLLTVLLQDRYSVKGKTTFKEEFVTAGGISMMEVDVHRMEVKKYSGLHVAGEVLDIDGITGGFNFQAAWTTGYIAGKSAVR